MRPARETVHPLVFCGRFEPNLLDIGPNGHTQECDELTAAFEIRDAAHTRDADAICTELDAERESRIKATAERDTLRTALQEARKLLQIFADGNGGHLGYSDSETCSCVRCKAKRFLVATRISELTGEKP